MGDQAAKGWLGDLMAQAAQLALPDFTLFDWGDRYGAFQWTWLQVQETRRVGVIAAAKTNDEPDLEPTFDLEFWAAIDQNNRFKRVRVQGAEEVPFAFLREERGLALVTELPRLTQFRANLLTVEGTSDTRLRSPFQ